MNYNYKKYVANLLFSVLLLSWFNYPAYAQQQVSGQVTDQQTQDPLPGVNITVKGMPTVGTTTNQDGEYTIDVPENQNVLVFSFVGFITREIEISGRAVVNVQLEPDVQLLEDVVVIGYGTQRKRDLTGSVSSISEREFNSGVSLAPEQLIQGKVAGVNIIQSSGQPGAASTVRIRGSSSVSAGNDPLYVIDGVPLQLASETRFVNVAGESTTSPFSSMTSNPLNILNSADIESIDILKDASATAIYGSRGANGVILITTKSQSESTVTYNTSFSVSKIRKKLPFLSPDEFRDFAQSNNLEFPDMGASTFWQDEIFRPAVSQNHNLSFGSGTGATSYRASLGYSNEDGIILGSNFEKFNGRLNLRHQALEDKLRMNLNLTAARVDEERTPISSNIGNEGGNILKDALRWAPTLPIRNEDGSFFQIGELRVNPVSWPELVDNSQRNTLLGDVRIEYDIFNSLSANVNLGHNNEFIERFNFVPGSHPVGENERGRASLNEVRNESNLFEANLNYSDNITENSQVNAVAGYSFQRFIVSSKLQQANQFPSDATSFNLIQSGNTLANTSNREANRLISFFGRINYQLLDRYLMTFTIRRDGSSRFGENNQWGLFPSGAFAWRVSNENFFPTGTISDLKFRVGYGVTGNQEIPNFLFMELLSIAGSSTFNLGGQTVPSVLPSNFANPDLKWERTTQLNLGMDFELFEGRLSGTVDYFEKNTNDLLLRFSTAAPSVVNFQFANVGEIENTGVEVSLDGVLIQKSDFQWRSNFNISTNDNKVISLSNDQFSRESIRTGPLSGVVASVEGGNTQIIKPGLPLNTFYGRKFTGFDENGMETYLDEDGDGNADLLPIGNPWPDFTFGFSNTINWKNFDSTIAFRGVVGNDIFNNTAAEFGNSNLFPGNNVLRSALTSGASRDQTAQFSSRWIEDGSYLRLSNLTIGYTINTDNIPFLSRARLSVSGQNLFVITGYSGFDPEVQTNTNLGGTAPIGIDYMAFPRPRQFQFGATLDF